MHYFVDKDDNNEYIYTQYEAADAHKSFPCFDQPNLKARYSQIVLVPKGWIVRSTVAEEKPIEMGSPQFSEKMA